MPKVNILLVDDRPTNLASLEALLSNTDYHLVTAASGEEALKALLEQEFAVIVLDVQMQGMDGFETASYIRAREKNMHTPIIFVTAFKQEDAQMLRGYSLGAVDYLFKPIVPDVFRAKIAVFADLYIKTQRLQEQADQIEVANRELEQRLDHVRRLNAELQISNKAMEIESAKRLEAERSLHMSEKLYRTLAQNLPQSAVFLFDHNLRFLVADGELLNSQGFSREKIQASLEGNMLQDVLPPDLADWLEAYCRAAVDGISSIFEWTYNDTFYSVQVLPIKDENGQIFAGLGMVQNITEVKLAEQVLSHSRDVLEAKVHERTQALEAQNRKLMLLNQAGQALIATLKPAQILQQLLTIAASLAKAHNASFWLLNAEDGSLVCQGVLAGDKQTERGYQISLADGLLGWVVQHNRPVQRQVKAHTAPDAALKVYADFEEGSRLVIPVHSPVGIIGVLELVSSAQDEFSDADQILIETLAATAGIAMDNARLFAAEARARQAAEEANEIKLQFFATISHELRTPLTSIKGFTTTLLATDVVWDVESQRRFLDVINEEADKLTDLIEQLLDVSRLQAGTLRIQAKPSTLSEVMAIAEVQLESLTTCHQLVVDVPADLPPILVDVRRIANVLVNLVDNAAKYSPAGSTITISAVPQDSSVQINVTDEGQGIPAENREKVFEAFWQLGVPGASKGIGLGLAICKGLITAHGGNIWITDAGANSGTTVSFTLHNTQNGQDDSLTTA